MKLFCLAYAGGNAAFYNQLIEIIILEKWMNLQKKGQSNLEESLKSLSIIKVSKERGKWRIRNSNKQKREIFLSKKPEFSISSKSWIRQMSFFDVEICGNSEIHYKQGKLPATRTNISQNKKLYIKTQLREFHPSLRVEIQRNDYIITSCDITKSGKDGSLVIFDCKSRMTLKSWLYYLCK